MSPIPPATATNAATEAEMVSGAFAVAADWQPLTLRPRTAARDAALHEALAGAGSAAGAAGTASRAAALSAVLRAGYQDLDTANGHAPDRMGLVERQAALLRLALDMGQWPAWFTCRCTACDALVDLQVAADEFAFSAPEHPSPDGHVTVPPLPGCDAALAFRIPDGTDERAIEALADDPRAAEIALTSRCAPGADLPGGPAAWAQAFEQALTPALPRFRPDLAYDCPECGDGQRYWFDPMDWISRHAAAVFAQVHQLARAYGWREPDILALSDARRAIYLDQIAAEAATAFGGATGGEVRP